MSVDLPETERWLPASTAPRDAVIFARFDAGLFGIFVRESTSFVKWVDSQHPEATGWWWCSEEGTLYFKAPSELTGWIR